MSQHKIRKKKKSRQHPDFPGGHPPEYYPSLRLLNFTERTGYGVLSLRWPSTLENVFLLLYMLVILLAIINNMYIYYTSKSRIFIFSPTKPRIFLFFILHFTRHLGIKYFFFSTSNNPPSLEYFFYHRLDHQTIKHIFFSSLSTLPSPK